MNYYTTTAGTSVGTVYVQGQSGTQTPVTIMLQSDEHWLEHNLQPLGFFAIELAIALAILAAARCALGHFLGSKPIIPTKRK